MELSTDAVCTTHCTLTQKYPNAVSNSNAPLDGGKYGSFTGLYALVGFAEELEWLVIAAVGERTKLAPISVESSHSSFWYSKQDWTGPENFSFTVFTLLCSHSRKVSIQESRENRSYSRSAVTYMSIPTTTEPIRRFSGW